MLSDTIEKIFTAKAGSFAFVLGFMTLVVLGTIFITKISIKQDNLQSSIIRIEDKLDNAIVKIDARFEKIDARFEKMDERFEKIDEGFSRLETEIAFMKGTFEYAFASKDEATRKKSPLSLTKIGERIATSYNLRTMVDENWNQISEHLKSTNIKHPYDLERFCIERTFATPEKFFSDNDIEKLHKVALKEDYHLLTITRIMTVLILDRYFTENNNNAN